MKNHHFILMLLLVFSITSCSQHSHKHITATDSLLTVLQKNKAATDKYLAGHQNAILLFAKLRGKGSVVKVEGDKWPDNTECSYDVLKNKAGKIILIGELPVSESGDRAIEHRHYFDADGKTFAYTKQESIFNDAMSGGTLREYVMMYFDADFNIIYKTDKLTDGKDKPVTGKKEMYDFIDDDYKEYKDVNSFLQAYHY